MDEKQAAARPLDLPMSGDRNNLKNTNMNMGVNRDRGLLHNHHHQPDRATSSSHSNHDSRQYYHYHHHMHTKPTSEGYNTLRRTSAPALSASAAASASLSSSPPRRANRTSAHGAVPPDRHALRQSSIPVLSRPQLSRRSSSFSQPSKASTSTSTPTSIPNPTRPRTPPSAHSQSPRRRSSNTSIPSPERLLRLRQTPNTSPPRHSPPAKTRQKLREASLPHLMLPPDSVTTLPPSQSHPHPPPHTRAIKEKSSLPRFIGATMTTNTSTTTPPTATAFTTRPRAKSTSNTLSMTHNSPSHPLPPPPPPPHTISPSAPLSLTGTRKLSERIQDLQSSAAAAAQSTSTRRTIPRPSPRPIPSASLNNLRTRNAIPRSSSHSPPKAGGRALSNTIAHARIGSNTGPGHNTSKSRDRASLRVLGPDNFAARRERIQQAITDAEREAARAQEAALGLRGARSWGGAGGNAGGNWGLRKGSGGCFSAADVGGEGEGEGDGHGERVDGDEDERLSRLRWQGHDRGHGHDHDHDMRNEIGERVCADAGAGAEDTPLAVEAEPAPEVALVVTRNGDDDDDDTIIRDVRRQGEVDIEGAETADASSRGQTSGRSSVVVEMDEERQEQEKRQSQHNEGIADHADAEMQSETGRNNNDSNGQKPQEQELSEPPRSRSPSHYETDPLQLVDDDGSTPAHSPSAPTTTPPQPQSQPQPQPLEPRRTLPDSETRGAQVQLSSPEEMRVLEGSEGVEREEEAGERTIVPGSVLPEVAVDTSAGAVATRPDPAVEQERETELELELELEEQGKPRAAADVRPVSGSRSEYRGSEPTLAHGGVPEEQQNSSQLEDSKKTAMEKEEAVAVNVEPPPVVAVTLSREDNIVDTDTDSNADVHAVPEKKTRESEENKDMHEKERQMEMNRQSAASLTLPSLPSPRLGLDFEFDIPEQEKLDQQGQDQKQQQDQQQEQGRRQSQLEPLPILRLDSSSWEVGRDRDRVASLSMDGAGVRDRRGADASADAQGRVDSFADAKATAADSEAVGDNELDDAVSNDGFVEYAQQAARASLSPGLAAQTAERRTSRSSDVSSDAIQLTNVNANGNVNRASSSSYVTATGSSRDGTDVDHNDNDTGNDTTDDSLARDYDDQQDQDPDDGDVFSDRGDLFITPRQSLSLASNSSCPQSIRRVSSFLRRIHELDESGDNDAGEGGEGSRVEGDSTLTPENHRHHQLHRQSIAHQQQRQSQCSPREQNINDRARTETAETDGDAGAGLFAGHWSGLVQSNDGREAPDDTSYLGPRVTQSPARSPASQDVEGFDNSELSVDNSSFCLSAYQGKDNSGIDEAHNDEDLGAVGDVGDVGDGNGGETDEQRATVGDSDRERTLKIRRSHIFQQTMARKSEETDREPLPVNAVDTVRSTQKKLERRLSRHYSARHRESAIIGDALCTFTETKRHSVSFVGGDDTVSLRSATLEVPKSSSRYRRGRSKSPSSADSRSQSHVLEKLSSNDGTDEGDTEANDADSIDERADPGSPTAAAAASRAYSDRNSKITHRQSSMHVLQQHYPELAALTSDANKSEQEKASKRMTQLFLAELSKGGFDTTLLTRPELNVSNHDDRQHRHGIGRLRRGQHKRKSSDRSSWGSVLGNDSASVGTHESLDEQKGNDSGSSGAKHHSERGSILALASLEGRRASGASSAAPRDLVSNISSGTDLPQSYFIPDVPLATRVSTPKPPTTAHRPRSLSLDQKSLLDKTRKSRHVQSSDMNVPPVPPLATHHAPSLMSSMVALPTRKNSLQSMQSNITDASAAGSGPPPPATRARAETVSSHPVAKKQSVHSDLSRRISEESSASIHTAQAASSLERNLPPSSRTSAADVSISSRRNSKACNSEANLRRLKKRRNVIKELIDTEHRYTQDMTIIVEFYMKSASSCSGIAPDNAKTLFGNADKVFHFTTRFQNALKKAARGVYVLSQSQRYQNKRREGSSRPSSSVDGDSEYGGMPELSEEKDRRTTIGLAFINHASRMEEVYAEYLKHHDAANRMLETLQKRETVRTWLTECKSLAVGLTDAWDLDSLLVKPVQRMLKYPLLLTELLNATPSDHPDHPHLQQALKETTAISVRINESKKRADVVGQVITNSYRKRRDSDVRSGLQKALTWRPDKMKAQQPHPHAERYADHEFDSLANQFGENFFHTQLVMRDVEEYLSHAQKQVARFVEYTDAIDKFVRGPNTPKSDVEKKWNKFATSVKLFSEKTLSEHVVAVRKHVVEPMGTLLKLHDGPQRVMQKRNKRYIDYIRYQSLKDSHHKPDKRTTEMAEQFDALNITLKEELPRLFKLSGKLMSQVLGVFAHISVQWSSDIQERYKSVLGYAAVNLSLEQNIRLIETEWYAKHSRVEASTMNLNIINGSLLAQFASGGSLGSPPRLDRSRRPSAISNLGYATSAEGGAGSSSSRPSQDRSISGRSCSSSSIFSSQGDHMQLGDSAGVSRTATPTPVPILSHPGVASTTEQKVLATVSGQSGNTVADRRLRKSSTRGNGDDATTKTFPLMTPTRSGHNNGNNGTQRRGTAEHPLLSEHFSDAFSSALPLPSPAPSTSSMAAQSARATPDRPKSLPKTIYTVASLYNFQVDKSAKEAGYRYLSYKPGEVFDVVGEKGDLWLAWNQDDPRRRIGWIWNKHFAKVSSGMPPPPPWAQ